MVALIFAVAKAKGKWLKVLLTTLLAVCTVVVGAIVYFCFAVWLVIGGGSEWGVGDQDQLIVAGTWEDDPNNWYRAFQEPVPSGVTVIHSKYWKSDHFTHEYIFYFEVKASDEWKNNFIKEGNLVLFTPSRDDDEQFYRSTKQPIWYLPGYVSDYEVWGEAGYNYGTIFIHKETGHIFFDGGQL